MHDVFANLNFIAVYFLRLEKLAKIWCQKYHVMTPPPSLLHNAWWDWPTSTSHFLYRFDLRTLPGKWYAPYFLFHGQHNEPKKSLKKDRENNKCRSIDCSGILENHLFRGLCSVCTNCRVGWTTFCANSPKPPNLKVTYWNEDAVL